MERGVRHMQRTRLAMALTSWRLASTACAHAEANRVAAVVHLERVVRRWLQRRVARAWRQWNREAWAAIAG